MCLSALVDFIMFTSLLEFFDCAFKFFVGDSHFRFLCSFFSGDFFIVREFNDWKYCNSHCKFKIVFWSDLGDIDHWAADGINLFVNDDLWVVFVDRETSHLVEKGHRFQFLFNNVKRGFSFSEARNFDMLTSILKGLFTVAFKCICWDNNVNRHLAFR